MSNISINSNSCTNQPVKFITFSDGSETCELPTLRNYSYIAVDVKVEDCTRDLVRIALVKDAIDRLEQDKVTTLLNLGYMPQARADRVFGEGMPLPVKVFADIINSLKFDEVIIADPHSDVTPALLHNVHAISQRHFVSSVHSLELKRVAPNFVICAPDLGATKKTFDLVQDLHHKEYVQAIKVRDVATGNIVKCDVMDDVSVKGRDVLIVDDIADGGASFKFLAQKLKEKGARKVLLYVTHGIFAKGLDELAGSIDYICVNNIVGTYINRGDVLAFNEGQR